ncbi:protein tyrosine phosphatase [Aquitalea magnusonii]|uniref:protein-tyrosine-phosphatase n=1 Tax=Aquitalea magnusonii TaxID=332411 RepID=A0A318JZP7_9NEIS|nr:protein tyrosine phosphatase [Aquitalea magnusonii]PXX51244.1 protein tyrosine phosphatase [Aquitalea magnusonii]
MRKFIALLAGVCLLAACGLALAAEPFKLAFVDTGNTGRSVTAEALARQRIEQQQLPIAVISRAVDMDPYDNRPEANAASLLLQRGIDVSAHRAAQLNANDVRHSDLILTMTAKHKAKVLELFPEARGKTFTLSEYASGNMDDVADAWGKPLAAYQDMLRQVEGYLPAVLDKAQHKKP